MTLSSAQTERAITFYSKGQPPLLLQGVIHEPRNVEKVPIIVLCHPQPASSDMNDTLTERLARRLAAEAGVGVFPFYFFGVGERQGKQRDLKSKPLKTT